tara:strand:+ start:2143 stop:2841 length:699 start_codon:yes stop_codon:yes gene_type:complete
MLAVIMDQRNGALLALLLVGFVPTLSIVFTIKINDNELISQVFFIVCKLWILVFPTYWYLRIEGNHFSWSSSTSEGLIFGAITGIVMSAIIVVMWILFGDTIDTESMITEMESTGLTNYKIYILGMMYWIFLNSLLEEYVFRWFITVKGIEIFGSEVKGIALSASMFTLHHSIALHLFGFIWWQTVVASVGLLSAAAIWSWLYVRFKSIWVCWLSHAICDVAVFGIGYMIIF